MCNWGEDAALRGLVPVKEGSSYHAYQAHGHGCRRYSEPDVHPRLCLNPYENCERNELSNAEAEVGGIEIAGELLGLLGVILSELVGPKRYYVGL